MSQNRSRSIAIGAIMTAFSLIVLTLGHFIKNLSITFNVLTVIILLFLYSANMKKAMVLCYIATAGLALVLLNFTGGVPYIMFYGGYTIIACVTSKLAKKYLPLLYLGKIIYFNGLIAIVFFAAKLIVNPTIIDIMTKNVWVYIGVSVAATAIFLIYDFLLVKFTPQVYSYLNKYIKLKKDKIKDATDTVEHTDTENNGETKPNESIFGGYENNKKADDLKNIDSSKKSNDAESKNKTDENSDNK